MDEDVELAVENLAGLLGGGEDGLRVGDVAGDDVDVGMGLCEGGEGRGRVVGADDGEDGVGGRLGGELADEFAAEAFGGAGDGVGGHCGGLLGDWSWLNS